MNTRYLKLSLAVTLALASSQTMALGLGQLQVKSGLNQPLVAEIPIIAAMPGEVDNLSVCLASPEAFERVGLTRPSHSTANLSFSVGKNARGQNVILITSSGKFVEPFLSFLIEADWGRGAVTKEYTALIDPPYIANAVVRPLEAPKVAVAPAMVAPEPEPASTLPPIVLKPEPEPQAPVASAEPTPLTFENAPVTPVEASTPAPVAVATAPEPTPQTVVAEQAPPPAPAPVPTPEVLAPAPTPVAETSPSEYGPVASGKTLFAIANEVRPDENLTVNQVMMALLRANPEAFIDDNVNKLKRGSVLRIPGRDETATLSDQEASALVAEQSSSWRSQRAPVPQPSETVAETAATPEPIAETPAPSLEPAAVAPVVQPTIAKSRPKARLEIVPPSGKSSSARAAQSGAAAAGGTELRAELTQAKEEVAVRDAEISELKSRVTDLEGQQTDTQKLIAMKDSQLKALQDELEKQRNTPAPAATSADAPPAAAAKLEAPWYLNPFVHYVGGGLLLLGGLVWLLRRSKNKVEDEEVVTRRISDDVDLQASLSSLQSAQKVHDQPVPNNTTQVSTSAKPVGKPDAAAKEDPELAGLHKLIRSKPQDLEAYLALLRYHYARGEAKEFESTAQTMRTHVGTPQDPRWREAVVMGVALLPGHALFNQAGWNTPRFEESTKPMVAASTPAPAPAPPASEEVSVFANENDFDEADVFEAVSITSPTQINSASSPAKAEEISVFSESDFVALDNMPDLHRSEAELMDLDAASSTKIELARAYLEIGDVEGARSMLEEVAASGSAPAKAMAERIIAELG